MTSSDDRWTLGLAARCFRGSVLDLGLAFKQAKQSSCQVALQASFDLSGRLSFLFAPGGVGPRFGIVLQPGEHDRVKGAVELSIATAIEVVADRLVRGGGDRCRPGDHREGRFGANPSRMRPRVDSASILLSDSAILAGIGAVRILRGQGFGRDWSEKTSIRTESPSQRFEPLSGGVLVSCSCGNF